MVTPMAGQRWQSIGHLFFVDLIEVALAYDIEEWRPAIVWTYRTPSGRYGRQQFDFEDYELVAVPL